jgi:hypothetical protein
METFGAQVGEVTQARIRYVLRRNPQRAAELAATRRAKQERLERELTKHNRYLAEHPRARGTPPLERSRASWAGCGLRDG